MGNSLGSEATRRLLGTHGMAGCVPGTGLQWDGAKPAWPRQDFHPCEEPDQNSQPRLGSDGNGGLEARVLGAETRSH